MALVEQIHTIAYDTNENPWLFEVVAGIIETGETVEDVARREALGEAEFEAGWTKPTLSYLVSSGGISERSSTLVGEVDTSTAKGIRGLTKENEDIRVHVVSREQAYQWTKEGKIDNVVSIITLQWLQLHHHNLRSG